MREPREYEAPLCAQIGGDFWFPEPTGDANDSFRAKRICASCSHQFECAEWGIQNEKHGIWGGLTANERRLLRRQMKITVRDSA